MGAEGVAVDSDEVGERPVWAEAPTWRLHLTLVAASAGMVWSLSVPSPFVIGAFLSLLALAGVGLVWAGQALAFARAWSGRRQTAADADDRTAARLRSRAGRFLVAPAGGLALLVAVNTDLSLKARWAASRPAFDEAARDALAGEDHRSGRRLGLYTITSVHRAGANVVFRESTGGWLFHDGGFAYLPDGPDLAIGSLDIRGVKDFRHLGGSWYAWTAEE
jgi:hypothetical protein